MAGKLPSALRLNAVLSEVAPQFGSKAFAEGLRSMYERRKEISLYELIYHKLLLTVIQKFQDYAQWKRDQSVSRVGRSSVMSSVTESGRKAQEFTSLLKGLHHSVNEFLASMDNVTWMNFPQEYEEDFTYPVSDGKQSPSVIYCLVERDEEIGSLRRMYIPYVIQTYCHILLETMDRAPEYHSFYYLIHFVAMPKRP